MKKKRLTPEQVTTQRKIYQEHAREDQKRFQKDIRPANFTNNTVILVDDGNAPALDLCAALASIKKEKPAKIILACPVLCDHVFDKCVEDVANVVTLDSAKDYDEVYACYERFEPQEAAAVRKLLEEARAIKH